jgi:hypothetical protein
MRAGGSARVHRTVEQPVTTDREQAPVLGQLAHQLTLGHRLAPPRSIRPSAKKCWQRQHVTPNR